jgi:hypothetical protein
VGFSTPRYPSEPPRYSRFLRSTLLLSALAVTLLPVPLISFGVLPTYRAQATFLLFYTPFVCLLTLCYLFYVRESLARAMFADVLNPPPPPDPYFREPLGDRLRRLVCHLKKVLLAILPVALVVMSMYSVSRYLTSLDHSITLAAQAYRDRAAAVESAAPAPGDRSKPGFRRSPGSSMGGRRSPGARNMPADSSRSASDSAPAAVDSAAVRNYVLRTTGIDDIPQLVELTIWYIGGFVALLIAVSLMGLKEYAREALGLTEHELMFGRRASPGAENS